VSLFVIAQLIGSRTGSAAANAQGSRSFPIIGIRTLVTVMIVNLATALMVQYVKLCKALSEKLSAKCSKNLLIMKKLGY